MPRRCTATCRSRNGQRRSSASATGEIRLLVASDVAARGLDIQGLSHVFCFDVPIHAEDYIHRIGRTARAGRLGRSFMLAAPEDGRAVAAIVKLIGKEIPLSVIPGIEEVELEYDERRRRGARRDTRPMIGSPPAHAMPAAGRRQPRLASRARIAGRA